jgi:hypothetical protein
MTAGDIMKDQNMIVEEFTVKSSEDIELGEVVYNDGNGILAATTGVTGPYFMALQAHTYSDPDPEAGQATHDIRCLVAGVGDCQAKPASATVKGKYVELSTTAGEVTLSDATAFTDICGIAMEAVATTGTDCKVLFGTFP